MERAPDVQTTMLYMSTVLWILGTITAANALLVVRLDMIPPKDMFCTGDRLELQCHHNLTHSQPDWRITNELAVVLRTVTFQSSTLQHHRIIRDTTVEDVLEISNILSNFDCLEYMCFYATSQGEVQSNTVTLKLHPVPPVRNAHAKSNNMTSVTLSWMQGPDTECNDQARVAHIVINYDDMKRLEPDITITAREGQTSFQYILTGLQPGVNYSISIHVSTNDGRRSAPAIIEFEPGALFLEQQGRSSTTTGDELEVAYILFAVSALLTVGWCAMLVANAVILGKLVSEHYKGKGNYDTEQNVPMQDKRRSTTDNEET